MGFLEEMQATLNAINKTEVPANEPVSEPASEPSKPMSLLDFWDGAQPITEIIPQWDPASGTTCPIGSEPSDIKEKMQQIFAELDEYYPDKEIINLSRDHSNLSTRIRKVYRDLGYRSSYPFLRSYGYNVHKEYSYEAEEVLEELAKVKAIGKTYDFGYEFERDYHELYVQLVNIRGRDPEIFDNLTIGEYLQREGIIK